MNLQKDNSVETLKIVQKILIFLAFIAYLIFVYSMSTSGSGKSGCYRYENSKENVIVTSTDLIEGGAVVDGNEYVVYTTSLGEIRLPIKGTEVTKTRC